MADVDLDARQVEIRQTMHFADPTQGVGLGEPKTELSRRVLSLDVGTADAQRRVKSRQRRERLAAVPAWRGADDPGARLGVRAADGVTRAAAVRHAYDAPHTAATLGFEAGVPLKMVSVQLGHANTRIMGDVYTICRATHDAAADTVATYVFGAAGDAVDVTTP